jgi:hypothetical protein
MLFLFFLLPSLLFIWRLEKRKIQLRRESNKEIKELKAIYKQLLAGKERGSKGERGGKTIENQLTE